MRKRNVVVTLSNAEAKYMTTIHPFKDAIWIMKLCSERAITIHCDSNNVICLAKNPTFHANTNHIDI
jgi:hypothetical protein